MSNHNWYFNITSAPTAVRPHGVIQTRADVRLIEDQSGPFTLPEHVLRLAHAEYTRRFPGQDFERIQERHGFGLFEVVGLLADHLDHLGAVPSPPRREADK